VYASVFAAWDEAGFARVNLHPAAWPSGPASARRFLGALAPGFLSGDPASFAELLRWDVELRPAALLSTALALSPALQAALSARYRCPVIDWYSTTETGPIACSRPGGPGLALLAPDLFVELVDGAGRPVPEGTRGEIAVTGGRNPYLPLLRYRTGDFARMALVPGPRGEPEPRLLDLEGRAAVLFRADDGSPVNPVDVGRALRHRFAVVQHEFVQRADRSCTARLRPAAGLPVDAEQVEAELRALFGPGTRLEVQIDPELGAAGKPVPYRCELEPPPAGA
jgi:phenylacetate-CoA ligase